MTDFEAVSEPQKTAETMIFKRVQREFGL